MKLTTLLVTLSIALQLGASNKNAHANAYASSAATQEVVGAEFDEKSGHAVVAPSSSRAPITRSQAPFWNMSRSTPERQAQIRADMEKDPAYKIDVESEESIDTEIIPRAITAANAGDFEALMNAFASLPYGPLWPVQQAQIEILNALFQMPIPQERDKPNRVRGFALDKINAQGKHAFTKSGTRDICLEISKEWVDFLLSPFDGTYHHPYELAVAIEGSQENIFTTMDPWALRGLFAIKFQQFRAMDFFMITAILTKHLFANDYHGFVRGLHEQELKQFGDEERAALCIIGDKSGASAYNGRTRVLERIKQFSLGTLESTGASIEYLFGLKSVKSCLNSNSQLIPPVWDIVAGYGVSYRYGLDAQITQPMIVGFGYKEQMIVANHRMIDNLETLPPDPGYEERMSGGAVYVPYESDAVKHAICRIELNNNLFSSLPATLGRKYPWMRKFEASKGLLSHIPATAFQGAHELGAIDLSHNFITDIPQEIYELPKLTKLNLEYNPLSEDAKKKYEAWKERRSKSEAGAAAPDASANAAAAGK